MRMDDHRNSDNVEDRRGSGFGGGGLRLGGGRLGLGSIVIAVVDGEYTIKRLYWRGSRIELRPENPAFQPICFADGSQLEIWGVVVGVVRRCLV